MTALAHGEARQATVRGPKIKGQLVAPSGDWLYVMPDGTLRLDVRVTIKTDDNALIFVEYGGIIASPKEIAEKFGKGEVVTAADGYFLTIFSPFDRKVRWPREGCP
jgi:Protein of unknown function (DUF3237)